MTGRLKPLKAKGGFSTALSDGVPRSAVMRSSPGRPKSWARQEIASLQRRHYPTSVAVYSRGLFWSFVRLRPFELERTSRLRHT